MGMFDSLMIVCPCPFCGANEEREIQTKDTEEQYLARYKPGDVVDLDKCLRKVRGIAACHSQQCESRAAAWEMASQGYVSGFSALWDVTVAIDEDGKLTDRVTLCGERATSEGTGQ